MKAAVPGRTLTAAEVPTVFVSTKPAEMILLHGDANYQLVTRYEAAVDQQHRQRSVQAREERSAVLPHLRPLVFGSGLFGAVDIRDAEPPGGLQEDSPSHPRSRVLASVPGTNEAAEAVLLAQVPQTARIDKKQVKAPEVDYQGDPQFQPIEKTTVSRAVNTDKDIIKVGDLYYMCFQGVWFMSKSAERALEVTGSVPGQIYEIPASSPAYNVTNVTVVEDNSDAVVFATAAAYTGMMVAWGCVVWGTGYYYPPYYGYGGFYPYLLPALPDLRLRRVVQPVDRRVRAARVAYGPYGGAGVASRYNPRTGTYSRGAAAYGPYGARGAAEAYNPRTGTYGQTRQGSGVYGSWGQTGVTRGDQWATTSRVTNNRTGATTRVTQGAAGRRRHAQRRGEQLGRGPHRQRRCLRGARRQRLQKAGRRRLAAIRRGGDWNSVQQPTPQQREQAQQRATDAQNRAGSSDTIGAIESGLRGSRRRRAAHQLRQCRPFERIEQLPPEQRRRRVPRRAAAAEGGDSRGIRRHGT